MGVDYYIKKLRDSYVVNQVKKINLPNFNSSSCVRRKIIFSGRVQKVGFRLEIYELSNLLGLTGWVRNRNDKSVEAEIQGDLEKIMFLINYMKSLKRAIIRQANIYEMPYIADEKSFILIKG